MSQPKQVPFIISRCMNTFDCIMAQESLKQRFTFATFDARKARNLWEDAGIAGYEEARDANGLAFIHVKTLNRMRIAPFKRILAELNVTIHQIFGEDEIKAISRQTADVGTVLNKIKYERNLRSNKYFHWGSNMERTAKRRRDEESSDEDDWEELDEVVVPVTPPPPSRAARSVENDFNVDHAFDSRPRHHRVLSARFVDIILTLRGRVTD
jgi:hypothetical protein